MCVRGGGGGVCVCVCVWVFVCVCVVCVWGGGGCFTAYGFEYGGVGSVYRLVLWECVYVALATSTIITFHSQSNC